MNKQKLRKHPKFILAGDVGGTNTTLGLFNIGKNKPRLLFLKKFKSNELKSITEAINEMLAYSKRNKIKINTGCLGVAGPVSTNRDLCKLTYVKWKVDTKEIIRKTGLKTFLVNDFEAIGYGVNLLKKNDIIKIGKNREALPEATKAVIGAGTGLGKSILVYQDNSYIPIPSEGGFSDFPAHDKLEMDILNFIKKDKGIKESVSNEQVISGKGIESIYLFLRKRFKSTKYTKEINRSKDKVPLISKYRNKDKLCKETFKLYTKFYARCVKNFVLDSLAIGGIYIAGGIASKNEDIFKTKEFINEFEKVNKQPQLLKKVPIFVIKNYNVSLYGAAYAAMKNELNLK
ncbi:MAG: glucokinase [Nanoarchaeota archaeon]|nr:glucokinase [Nanoarchaeota archaeon]